MNKFFKITKALSVVVFSILAFCFTLLIKVIVAMLLDDSDCKDNEESSTNSFYVIDEHGNEMLDDHVTYVFDLDNQRDLKGPL